MAGNPPQKKMVLQPTSLTQTYNHNSEMSLVGEFCSTLHFKLSILLFKFIFFYKNIFDK